MSRVCDMCGKGPAAGKSIIRKGSPKYKGGIGLHTTGISKRRFEPNLMNVHVRKPNGQTCHMKVCASCLKAGRVTKA